MLILPEFSGTVTVVVVTVVVRTVVDVVVVISVSTGKCMHF